MGSEEAEEGMQPTLIMLDDDEEAFWALGVSKKGVTAPIAKLCVDVIDRSGYVGQKITFKTDQEPSILALKRAAAATHGGDGADQLPSQSVKE